MPLGAGGKAPWTGGRSVPRFFALLALADLGTLGGLAGQVAASAASSGATDASTAGGLGTLLGMFTSSGYILWPVMSLRERDQTELRAFRMLCWTVLALHPLVIAALGADFYLLGRDAAAFVFLTGPLCVSCTPLLFPIAFALFHAPWLNLAAPAGNWDLPSNPTRRSRVRQAPVPHPRTAAPLGPATVRGLLCVPLLFVLDAVSAAALVAVERADAVDMFAGMMEGSVIVLLVVLPFILSPLMIVLALNIRTTEALRPWISRLLALVHLALTALFAIQAFRPDALDPEHPLSQAARALLTPPAWALVAALPLAFLLAVSAIPARPSRR